MKPLIIVLITQITVAASVKPPPICCFPTKYETFMFISQGDVDVGSMNPDKESGNVGYGYGYENGTASTAFDGINQLTYTHMHSITLMSIYPIPIILDNTDILDYKTNEQWRIYADGSCDKMDVGLPLYEECIPGNATLLSEGTLGNTGSVVKTYFFHDRIYLDPYEVTVSVIMSDSSPGECIPVRMTMSDSYVFDSNKNIDITVADIFDVSPGIKDPSIFNPPSACKDTEEENKATRRSGGIFETVRAFARRT